MKAIRRIARTELYALFYSPIAWLLLTVFLIQTSMTFAGHLSIVLYRNLAGYHGFELTASLFAAERAVLWQTIGDLYLFIPLLTMGLISRELHSGSMKLLLSSPVRILDIVLGKFTAIMVYCGLLAGVLLLLLAVSSLAIEAVDYPAVMTGILGFYLLACAYGAIGLFMSALTPHQVVAAISTLAVLTVLNFIGEVGQTIPLVRDVTYWLSLSGRVDVFRFGLITTKHVFYFLAVIGLFLSFTVLKLSAGRNLESISLRFAKYAAVTLAAVALGYVTSLPALTGYLDTTRVKSQSLTAASVDIVEQIDGPWRITSYVNVLDRFARFSLPPSQNEDFDRFEQYTRYNPKLEMDYVMYYGPSESERLYRANPGKSDAELARHRVEQWGMYGLAFDDLLPTEQATGELDLASQRYRLTRNVEWGGNSALLRMYDDVTQHPREAEISAALKRLVVGPKTIAVASGNGERSAFRKDLQDYHLSLTEISDRDAMVSHGFDVVGSRLDKSLPADTDILLIADPQEAYSAGELAQVGAYLQSGGNAVIAVEPSRRDRLTPLLQYLGIRLLPGKVYQSHEEFSDEVVFAEYAETVGGHGFVPSLHLEYSPVLLNGTTAIKTDPGGPFAVAPLLVSQTGQPLAVLLTRDLHGREQRIVVVGDADFMSNGELRRKGVFTNNDDFIADLFHWLSDGEYPVKIERPDFPDKRLLVDRRGITTFKIVFYAVLPTLIIVFSTLLLLRRRRY